MWKEGRREGGNEREKIKSKNERNGMRKEIEGGRKGRREG